MQGLVRALDMRLLRREGKLQEEEGMAAMASVATITITEKVRPATTKTGKKVLVHTGRDR